MSRLKELLEELHQDLSIEAGETKDWGMLSVYQTTIHRVQELLEQANREQLRAVANGDNE